MACLVRAFRWKLSDVQREMKEVEPLARSSLAASVLMKLRGRWAVPAQCEMVLLQGFALKLHDLGFGVVLHKATAAGIRATIFNNAKSNYLFALKAARKAGRATLAVPFQPTGEPAVAMDWLPRLFQHLFSTHCKALRGRTKRAGTNPHLHPLPMAPTRPHTSPCYPSRSRRPARCLPRRRGRQ